jgi:hypothetical protein
MRNEEMLRQIELSDKEATDMVKKAEALERLYKNRDFKKVVLEGYLEQEPVRLSWLIAMPNSNPTISREDYKKDMLSKIEAIGEFRQYLQTVFALGNQAHEALEENQNLRTEILEGE